MQALLDKLNALGISLRIQGGDLKAVAPKGVITPELAQEIKENKEALFNAVFEKQAQELLEKVMAEINSVWGKEADWRTTEEQAPDLLQKIELIDDRMALAYRERDWEEYAKAVYEMKALKIHLARMRKVAQYLEKYRSRFGEDGYYTATVKGKKCYFVERPGVPLPEKVPQGQIFTPLEVVILQEMGSEEKEEALKLKFATNGTIEELPGEIDFAFNGGAVANG